MDIHIYFWVNTLNMTDLAKKLNKRWGKKHVDNRDWPEYNEQLVKRGEYLLDLDWVESWDEELEEMNRNKVGPPYRYPDSLIKIQAIWHTHNIPYRMIEGITRQLYRMVQLPAYNDYTTANRRVNKLDVILDVPTGERVMLFADGTGFQAIEGGEYLRSKYGKKNRRWVQVVILGDPVTKEPVSFEVNIIQSSEPDSAQSQLGKLIEAGVDVEAFGGDGGFDKIGLWNDLEQKRIKPIIKPPKNAVDDSDSTWRNINVKYLNQYGYQKWASNLRYGLRWTATEGIYSAIKRMFGEQLHGKTETGMIQEIKMKFWTYKTMKQYGEA
jgi:hypothetical protein